MSTPLYVYLSKHFNFRSVDAAIDTCNLIWIRNTCVIECNSFITCIYKNHWLLDNFVDAIENIIRIEKAIVIRHYMHVVLFHSKSDSSIFLWTVLFNFPNFLKFCLLMKIFVLNLFMWCPFLTDKFWCFFILTLTMFPKIS